MSTRTIEIAGPGLALTLAVLLAGCGGTTGGGDDEDATEDTITDTADDAGDDAGDAVGDVVEDPGGDAATDTAVDTATDTAVDTATDAVTDTGGDTGPVESDVERVIFLGDSITASPYLTPPWSDRIRDDLRAAFGADVEIHNYAVGGARTEHVLEDQIPNIDTTSIKPTLVMFTIGGNDALQVIGSDVDTALAHMEDKMDNLRAVLEFLDDPTNFPGGTYVIYSNIYDPTDGEGDFTHCGIGAMYEDWPEVEELATIVNGWYEDLADEFGFAVLDMHSLFLGHGWNNDDTENPYYCNGCEPDCPCPRWFDFTCIHPNAAGHEALAGFFFDLAIETVSM
jgi:lysophospholipase L1-like esterase